MHETLFDRVRHVRGGGGVRRGADSGLIGVQAALEAQHQTGTHKPAENRPEVERVRENHAEHRRNIAGVDNQSHQGEQDVENAHAGHEDSRHFHDTLSAAEEAVERRDGDDGPENHGHHSGVALVEREPGEGRLQVIGREHIVAHAVAGNQSQRKDNGKGAAVQGLFDVVGGAAVAGAVGGALLVNLRQRRLDERRRAAEHRRDPHPEHRARAAEANGIRHADDVAGADAGGRRNHQRAERRNGGVRADGLLRNHPDGFAEEAELRELQPDGEVHAAAEEQ